MDSPGKRKFVVRVGCMLTWAGGREIRIKNRATGVRDKDGVAGFEGGNWLFAAA